MSGVELLPEGSAGVAAMVVLTVGVIASVIGVPWSWAVFVVGFVGIVPLVAVLSADEESDQPSDSASGPARDREAAEQSRTEALETLRERYARGELTHEEFERKLEALMETESPEGAERRVERERERKREHDRERA